MKTTMNIPKELLREAVLVSGASSQTMAVIMGLHELIKRQRMRSLAAMRGTGAISLSESEQKRMRIK